MKHRILAFWTTYAALLLVATIAGLELLSSFVVPSWPARELRPVVLETSDYSTALSAAEPHLGYNSWGLRDWERSVARPAGVDFRAVLVGDSFLEGGFVSAPVTARAEQLIAQSGRRGVEVINLGVSATDPPQYYHRIKNVALVLRPDALIVHFYSGNDFVYEPFRPWEIPPLLAERPLPSLLGTVAPRLTWLAVNRLKTSQFGQQSGESEFEALKHVLDVPRERRYEALAHYVKKYHLPQKDEVEILKVLARGGDKFWDAFEKHDHDQEYLQGWWVAGIVGWEAGDLPSTVTDEEIARSIDQEQYKFKATLSWLVGARDLARQAGVKFLIVLAPTGGGDPLYREFWKPWPHYRGVTMQREAWHRAFRTLLEANGMPIADLSDDLRDVPGTYRLSDGHWTGRGTEIAAKRIASELAKLRDSDRR